MTPHAVDTYSVGIATGDITPPVGVPLCGFAGRGVHSSTGVYHPLRAVAIVINDGDTEVLFISAEWLGFYELTNQVRQRLSETTGIPPSRIVLAGTHTHCGPVLRKYDEAAHGRIDHEYIESALSTLATISERAQKHRYPASLMFGVGHCPLAMNRRIPDPENPGKVKRAMTPNPDGPTDHQVPVLAVFSDDILRATLFSYACHPTSRSGLLFGGDYVGFAYDSIQEAFPNAQPAFFQGCAGDQKPRPVNPADGSFGLRSVGEVREIGHELGKAVADVLKTGSLKRVAGKLEMRQTFLTLQTEPLDERAIHDTLLNPAAPSYQRDWALHHQHRISQGLPEQRTVPFEIQTIRFGHSLAIVTWAAEMSVEHGTRLKRDLQDMFAHVLPIAYTNDIIGYIPAQRQFSEFGYEVLDANQYDLKTGRYVSGTEDAIHTTVLALLKDEHGKAVRTHA